VLPKREPSICRECGLTIDTSDAYRYPITEAIDVWGEIVSERYQLNELILERFGVDRFQGIDTNQGKSNPQKVLILRERVRSQSGENLPLEEAANVLPDWNELPPTIPLTSISLLAWPGLEWERMILERSHHLSLPRVIDYFVEGNYTFLVQEVPEGRSLRDAWADPNVTDKVRFGWLIQVAEAIKRLNESGAMIVGLRPEWIIISLMDQPILRDLTGLVPLPPPDKITLERSYYMAPELFAESALVDARAALYGFGTMLYSLYLGRDFDASDLGISGKIKPFLDQFPDVHPLLGRLVAKTMSENVEYRFPTGEKQASDPTGMNELVDTLKECSDNLDRVSFDISSWSTTGGTRTGNEDSVTVIHSRESRLEDKDEFALLILADGMGGMESGEIAAAIAVQTIRDELLHEPPFRFNHSTKPLAPPPKPLINPNVTEVQMPALKIEHQETARQLQVVSSFRADSLLNLPSNPFELNRSTGSTWLVNRRLERDGDSRQCQSHQRRLMNAIRQANEKVFESAQSGFGQRGMGCTLEAIIIDGSNAIIGHVGDSRVYHYRSGKMTLLTSDQTVVNRMVEEGRITPEEAENHPRRSELQQAIGGRIDIFPTFYVQELRPGDGLLVCSDGLTNTLRIDQIERIFKDPISAELTARKLVNTANLFYANDNVSVIVVRVY
jgi:serine/threonine protein phosphatase PrpC